MKFHWTIKNVFMWNILLHLYLACRFINKAHARKEFWQNLPCMCRKDCMCLPFVTVNMYNILTCTTILSHDSPGTIKPRLLHQSLNILLCQHKPKQVLLQIYKSNFLLYTYCWKSSIFKSEFVVMPRLILLPENSTLVNYTGLCFLVFPLPPPSFK